jgi:hypothetical protein
VLGISGKVSIYFFSKTAVSVRVIVGNRDADTDLNKFVAYTPLHQPSFAVWRVVRTGCG